MIKSKVKKKSKKIKINNIENIKFTKSEINNINKNYLINSNNIFKSNKEILFANGFFTKNENNNMYINFDPLMMNSFEFAIKMIYLLAPCLSSILIQLYNEKKELMNKIIMKNFKRLTIYFDINTDLSGDVMLQMKLFKYILNENIFPRFKKLSIKKIITYLEELILYRNLLSHQVHKKKDYQEHSKKKTKRKRSNFHQKHKIRNFNIIKQYINKIQFIIKELYNNKSTLKFNFDTSIFNRYYVLLKTIKHNLDYICLIRERRKQLELLIKDDNQLVDIADSTLKYLLKSLNNKTKKIKTARNIVNLITTRIEDDIIFKNYFDYKISNKKCKEHCKNI
jgi:hypothetical protein